MSSRQHLRVLHLSSVIYKDDFVDTLIRPANSHRFRVMTCMFAGPKNLRPRAYGPDTVLTFRGRLCGFSATYDRDGPCRERTSPQPTHRGRDQIRGDVYGQELLERVLGEYEIQRSFELA
jgi:hypothetical protein